jgi:single-strand DNA-binding protein
MPMNSSCADSEFSIFNYWRKTMSSKSVNKVILVGNLGQDPEVKYTASRVPVARFSLATNEGFKDQSGEFQERTEWHSVVAWQKVAEIVGEFVSKGSRIYVEGKLQTSEWKDRLSGEKRYRTEIVARELVLLGTREKGNGVQPPRSAQGEKAKSTNLAGGGTAEGDNDVPF